MLGLLLARYGFFEALRSDYGRTSRATEEAAQLALESSDAHSFLLSQFFQAWGLLHQGRWGEMRRILDHGLEMADRNEHHRWAVLYRLQLAWLHAEAFDFERAREMCEQAHEQARKIHHPYTESLGLILMGRANLGLDRNEAALQCFNQVATSFDRERSLMDWILRMPLHYGLSRYWLAQRQPAQAREHIQRVSELAALPGERTYLALAHQTLAEIDMAEEQWEDAEVEVSKALAVIEGAEIPLAEWRVCETAAQLSIAWPNRSARMTIYTTR
jgi:tetratricopeptide (TPR) repeat protein